MTSSHQEDSATSGSTSAHPGTSGRSPPPPRGGVGGGAAAAAGGGAGRPSIGTSSIGVGVGALPPSAIASGRPSLDLHPGRLSYGSSSMHGTRLSYGTSSGAIVGGGGTTPHHAAAGGVMSPPSTSSTNNNVHSQSDFFAALSPTTAKYLRGQTSADCGVGEEAEGGLAADGAAASEGTAAAAAAGPFSPASTAAANAMRTAANAARGIGSDHVNDDGGKDDDANGNPGSSGNNNAQGQQSQNQPTTPIIGQDHHTIQLRSFVQSLLGMQLPATTAATTTTTPTIPNMSTPDPTTASFYATSLLTQTAFTNKKNGTTTYWRPDDAYLAARALSLKGEHKRAIWILDKVGLIGFGMGGDAGGGGNNAEQDEFFASSQTSHSTNYANSNNNSATPAISNEQGIRNALLLRAESALLAGQCLVQAGEHERAITVYEEAMRFPPPPPPLEWGMYGYGYRLDNHHGQQNNNNNDQEEGEDVGGEEIMGFDAKLADEMYIRSWREQSLSHMALIDDGDDERLLQLAANIRPLPFANSAASAATPNNNNAMEGIHPIARLCTARGIAYDEISNPHRAVPFLRMALQIDARCMEALDHVVRRRLLTPEEEREWISGLDFGSNDGGKNNMLDGMGIGWLRDAYLARLRGGSSGLALPPTALKEGGLEEETAGDIIGEPSPVPRVDLQSPSMLSLGSPDFAGGAATAGRAGGNQQAAPPSFTVDAKKSHSISQTIDEAFRNLSIHHNLGTSPDVLSHAAIRSYSAHDLRSALAYCTVLDAVDPYCRTAGYVHVATLVGLGLKRRLFQLAHRLVDTDPKDALAWFAVGSYYYACRRYDLAQRHFSRSTRLDPGSAECWIGFGCSFAVCDESDQALASFRAAQNKYSGSHVPLL
ncbi:hypothetical protein ACHAXR_003880, partial [Thalassiosira sp. AJA248-18]